jgi:hypothetical protein
MMLVQRVRRFWPNCKSFNKFPKIIHKLKHLTTKQGEECLDGNLIECVYLKAEDDGIEGCLCTEEKK